MILISAKFGTLASPKYIVSLSRKSIQSESDWECPLGQVVIEDGNTLRTPKGMAIGHVSRVRFLEHQGSNGKIIDEEYMLDNVFPTYWLASSQVHTILYVSNF